MTHLKPIDFIETLRGSDKYIEKIYMHGGCYQFYKILKAIYPNAKPFINLEKNHIATKIGKDYYDITGYALGVFTPLVEESEIAMCEKWSFYKNYWLYKSCPHCAEKIPITNVGQSRHKL